MRKVLSAWWPVAAWALLIGVATMLPISPRAFLPRGLPADKIVHAGMYLGLGWALVRAMRITAMAAWPRVGLTLGALLFGALDEVVQRWIPRRTPSLTDWLADAVGIGLALLVFGLGRRGDGRGRSGAAGDGPAGIRSDDSKPSYSERE